MQVYSSYRTALWHYKSNVQANFLVSFSSSKLINFTEIWQLNNYERFHKTPLQIIEANFTCSYEYCIKSIFTPQSYLGSKASCE